MEVTSFLLEELNAYKLANIAKLSYNDELEFKKEIRNFTNPDDIYFYDAAIDGYSDAQMYTLIYKDKIIFSIRGTSSIKDAITDIKFKKTLFQDVQYTINNKKYKNIKVHKGFLSQFNTIKFRIISYIFSALWGDKCKNISTNKIHVIFSSHSLGAAISTLASAMLKAHFHDKIFVENWTFGCPRVGNNSFIKYYQDNIDISNIYVYGNDIVTKIPKIGFKTFNKKIKLKDTFEKPSWCIKKINYYIGEIDDHYIDNYIRALDSEKTILFYENNSITNHLNNSITNKANLVKNTTVVTITHPSEKIINNMNINININNNDSLEILNDNQNNNLENEYSCNDVERNINKDINIEIFKDNVDNVDNVDTIKINTSILNISTVII
jgi:hypothetical protein